MLKEETNYKMNTNVFITINEKHYIKSRLCAKCSAVTRSEAISGDVCCVECVPL